MILQLRAAAATLTLCALSLLAMPALAAAPGTVGLQGALHNASGGAAPDGSYSMSFSLYDGKDAKTALWTEGLSLPVKGGRFMHQLGSATKIDWAKLHAAGALWLGVKVGADPELSRVPVQSVFFARVAATANGLACKGCVEGEQLGAAAVKATHLGFPYAGSATKGGPANKALALDCTGCVGSKQLKFDGDLDLGKHGLKAAKLTATEVVASSVTATKFVGDGSALTGIKTASGSCKPGEAMTGVDKDGKPTCAALQPKLAADLLDDVSNGALSNEFLEVVAGAKNIPIPDNDPTGKVDVLDFPDVGNAKTLTVRVHATNSDISKLTLSVFDPANKEHVLYAGAKKGTEVKGAWPKPDALVSGDLGAWLGKNPKGKWRLKFVDKGYKDNKTDGAVVSWSVEVGIVAKAKVASHGMLLTEGGLRLQRADKHPHTCAPALKAYMYYNTKRDSLYVCNGTAWFEISVSSALGSDNRPATSCKAIADEGVAKESGWFLIDVDGQGPALATKQYCDLSYKGGGWTQIVACRPGDNCVVGGKFLYTENWVLSDRGTPAADKSYMAGKTLGSVINNATQLLIIVESNAVDRGWVQIGLNNDTRQWLSKASFYQSGNIAAAISDTHGVSTTGNIRICWAPTNSYPVRSIKGINGQKFLGRTTGNPNSSANGGCDYGPWGSQMLIRGTTNGKTSTWGFSPSNNWNGQKYTHRILVR